MSKYSVDNFKKGDMVSITWNEDGKDVTYTGTVTNIFKPAINAGTVRIKDKNLKYGFKDMGIMWIDNVDKYGNKFDGAKAYKCIKGFNIPLCDDNGFTIENEYTDVEEGLIWNVPEDKDYRFIGGEVRLESYEGWIEITKEDLKEHFEEF
ncbi:MAG: hypothetical protein E6Y83_05595 [Clostridium butyricum]|nr:hypothetical protein [Clostridium butyricum]